MIMSIMSAKMDQNGGFLKPWISLQETNRLNSLSGIEASLFGDQKQTPGLRNQKRRPCRGGGVSETQ